jgi:hypothetical protein
MAARKRVVLPLPFGPIRIVGAPDVTVSVENRHLARDDAGLDEHQWKAGGGCAHSHPA